MSDEPLFNEIIHAPLRFRICGMLRHVRRLEFHVIRDTLGVSDATLSKHLKVLMEAGFVEITKEASSGRNDARRLTWVGLTPSGSDALRRHLAALQTIAG